MNIFNFDILKDENALIIFVSQLVSAICDKMMSIGLIWYLTKSFSIDVVPWYLTISFLPHLLLALHSAKFINKLGALNVVIGSEVFRALILFIMFFLIKYNFIEGHSLLVSLFISAFFIGIASSLFNPAILSIPPLLVKEEKVVALNAMIDSSISISSILGATFSIFLLNLFDLKTLILINALGFLSASIVQLKLKIIKKESHHEDEHLDVGPIEVLKKYPDIAKMLFSFLLFNLVLTPIFVLIPWYVEKVYAGDSSTLASIEGAMGLGAFLCGIGLSLSGFEVKEEKRIFMISVIGILFGLFFMFFSFSNASWQGGVALFFIGVVSTFLNIQVITYFQTSTKPKEVPAIMAAVNMISAASIPLSLSISGILFPVVYVPSFSKSCALIVLIVALSMPAFLKNKEIA